MTATRREILELVYLELDRGDWSDVQRDLRDALTTIRESLDRGDYNAAENMAVWLRGYAASMTEKTARLHDLLHRTRTADPLDWNTYEPGNVP